MQDLQAIIRLTMEKQGHLIEMDRVIASDAPLPLASRGTAPQPLVSYVIALAVEKG
jgi:hypothetical protein